MIEKISFSPQDIIAALHTSYGIAVSTLTYLPLGADMNASTYKAETRDGASYFLKLKYGHQYDINIAILELLQKVRIEQIILPI